MKKLYTKKSTVHPSPPLISDHLALLPAAIFTLTLTLSPQDKEVLAYLISSTTIKTTTHHHPATTDHPPLFNCSCFRCYMSYWVRWDSSPNRHLIHQIIDGFEEGLVHNKRELKNKKDRKKKAGSGSGGGSTISNEDATVAELGELTRLPELSDVKVNEFESVVESEDGPVKKLVSFLGERIWSVWT